MYTLAKLVSSVLGRPASDSGPNLPLDSLYTLKVLGPSRKRSQSAVCPALNRRKCKLSSACQFSGAGRVQERVNVIFSPAATVAPLGDSTLVPTLVLKPKSMESSRNEPSGIDTFRHFGVL